MVITKTPYRISFFGGGTDYPSWYAKEEGAVLSTTIDKYCLLSCRIFPPFFATKFRIVWSHIENVSTIGEILHPAVREGLRYFGFTDETGLEIHYQGDLPARAGMGSSSAFAVGLFKALSALKGEIISTHDLALKAIELEQKILKENVGSQDQVAAAYGGFNVIRFLTNGNIRVEPVTISQTRLKELESRLLMFYTGTSRLSSDIAVALIANMGKKAAQLRKMKKLIDKALKILGNGCPLDDFGELLHENWMIKRELTDTISNAAVDGLYETARAHGAIGGKLLGAGGSGFMVFYVPPEKKEAVIRSLFGYLHVPFKFENEGCSILHYREDQ
jgi:D-glycero-alpha-D-manno-heptose-7-phosphate kinase